MVFGEDVAESAEEADGKDGTCGDIVRVRTRDGGTMAKAFL